MEERGRRRCWRRPSGVGEGRASRPAGDSCWRGCRRTGWQGALILAGLDAGRSLDGVLGALSIWTIVASQIFSGSTVMWLSFAEALGFVGLAFIGLTVHEVDTWRASHGLGAMAWAGEGASREESVRRAA